MSNHERRIFRSNRGAVINDHGSLLGVDIGGTHIRVGVVSSSLTLQHEEIIDTDTISGKDAGERLANYLINYIHQHNLEVKAISMGFPSNINKERNFVIATPNVPGLENIPKSFFEEKLNVPVLFEKDTCMLLHYDMHHYQLKEGLLIGFYIGTGFGNIILLDGRILIGKDGVAGELGHIPVLFKDDPCGCGLQGCAEVYAAGKGLERIRQAKFPETHISEMFIKHGDAPEIREFIENMAKIIVVEIQILNPDYVIIGGGVINMVNFPYEFLIENIHKYSRKPVPDETLEIFRSKATDSYSGVIGAALFAQNSLKERKQYDSVR
ncbi:MAG: allose kinase [Brevefilum sp.]|jgi:allose kinase